MKNLSAFAFGIICVGISAGQQTPSADATLPAANETKGLVQGKVVQEPGGEGIPGALVTLTNYSATTDERGQFKIEGMKLGSYYLVYLSRSGYVANGKTNREKWVKAGQDTKDIVLHMAAGGIGGRILDAEGHPMRNVSVEAVTAKSDGGAGRNWASRGDGITNELGEYQIANLSPGKYIVQTRPEYPAPLPSAGDKGTRKERLVYAKTYFPGTLDEHQAVMVEVPPEDRQLRTSECKRVMRIE